MKWIKRGFIYNSNNHGEWNHSTAMVPTPEILDEKTVRVYIGSCDPLGRARISYVDCEYTDAFHIKEIGKEPYFDIGKPGTFDDNGCSATSIVNLPDGKKYLYYFGFEICSKIRYRLFAGLSISNDHGKTFSRYSNVPILDRSDIDFCFRSGSFVLFDDGKFKMWYVAGSNWETIDGKEMPVYVIKYLESADGLNWNGDGSVCIDIESENEHGFGRPYVIKENGLYKMFYSRRVKHIGYRMGYAESIDGINWIRKDDEINLDVSSEGWDSEIVCYPAVIKLQGKYFMFYNGNGFGKTGFGYAELESW